MHRAIDFVTKQRLELVKPSTRLLKVEDCVVSGLQSGIAQTMAYMPTIMFHVEALLRSQEALTATALNDIGFQSDADVCRALISPNSSAKNLERLEFLGDSVLKFMTTTNAFCNHPQLNEGALTAIIHRLVNNARLHRSTLSLGLEKYLTTEAFSAPEWTLAETAPVQRKLSTKLLADCIESLLGAAHRCRSIDGDFKKVVQALAIFLPEVQWNSPSTAIAQMQIDDPPLTTNEALLEDVEGLIGYKFGRRVLLAEALNHSSPVLPLRSYDRLELLGDAVIDLIIKQDLFDSNLQLREGDMTKICQALSNANIMAFLATQACVRIEDVSVTVDLRSKQPTMAKTIRTKCLHDFLFRSPNEDLAAQRSALLRRYDHVADRVAQALKTDAQFPWADIFHLAAPKWASDVFESIIGACFVDSGADLSVCRKVLAKLGLVDLLQRAVSEAGIEYSQKREDLQNARPGKINFVKSRYRDPNTNEFLWRCTVLVDGQEIAAVSDCSCEAEAEERAATAAFLVIGGDKDRKRKRDAHQDGEETLNNDDPEVNESDESMEL